MKKRYLLLAGIILSTQLMACGPKTTDKAAETKETVNAEAAKAESEVKEESQDTDEAKEEATGAETDTATEEAAAEVRPDYDYSKVVKKLGSYEGLTVQVAAKTEVTDEMVKTTIDSRLAAYPEVVTEGSVETGDIAKIDYCGKKDGVAFDGGTAEGYDLTIGSGQFIPGFEDGLVGVKIGDTVDLNLTFPEGYQAAELAGAEVVFTVTVHSVQRASELTDELAETLSDGECKDIASYEKAVRKELEDQATAYQEAEAENLLLEEVLNATELDELPADVLDYDAQRSVAMYEKMLYYYYGITLEYYCSMNGSTEEEFKAMVTTEAEENLKYEILEQAILAAEGITLTEEDFNAYAAELAAERGYETEEFLNVSAPEDIWRMLYRERAGKILLEKNSFEEIVEAIAEEKEEEKKDEAEAEEKEKEEADEKTEDAESDKKN